MIQIEVVYSLERRMWCVGLSDGVLWAESVLLLETKEEALGWAKVLAKGIG